MSGRLSDEQRGGDLAEVVSTIRAAQPLSTAG